MDDVEIDPELELRSTSDALSINEKVYLAIFICIQRLRASDKEMAPYCIPFALQNNVCESMILAFEKETALIANDFNEDSGIG